MSSLESACLNKFTGILSQQKCHLFIISDLQSVTCSLPTSNFRLRMLSNSK